ncbi:MAG: carboxynorspermidine decarboxylase [Butyrivibrio sp.]|nr:carboxynorspermidine decarboxylase [Acetatifactor muris]MCM1559321.1 carboxynorspermidine decarboxylase [Butyrivibrio sp.]
MEWVELSTPCYIVDERLIEHNLKILRGVMERTGAKILLAQKAFSMYALYPLIGEYLSGAAASGLYEARLCEEEMCAPLRALGRKPENHIFSPAYRQEDFEEILKYCGHIVFNSLKQVEKYGRQAKAAGKSIGLRVNPECSTQEGHAIYDPCAPGSRLGVTREALPENTIRPAEEEGGRIRRQPEIDAEPESLLSLVDGLHFHTLCEQDSDALEKTLEAVEERFGEYLWGMQWINFGGGHHITREGYDIPRLERCIRRMQQRYGLTVYLEPGEAVALNAGFLVSSVLEVQGENVILDTSAACHMPDVLEMPYRPPLQGSGEPGEKPFTYRLGGPTCLAGDRIGEYSFDTPLQEGDRLIFEDMAIYSMVKTNTFNGMPLPDIVLREKSGEYRRVRQFGYEDFKMRL